MGANRVTRSVRCPRKKNYHFHLSDPEGDLAGPRILGSRRLPLILNSLVGFVLVDFPDVVPRGEPLTTVGRCDGHLRDRREVIDGIGKDRIVARLDDDRESWPV